MLFLNVSTRQDLVWRALVSELTKVFPREETLQSRANFLLRFYSISLFSYYQWVRLVGKQAGDRRRKIWHVLTEHMCVCLKIVASTNSGPLLLMRPHWRHEPELLECVQMPESGGSWAVGCDSHSVCLNCLCLHKKLHNKRVFAWHA